MGVAFTVARASLRRRPGRALFSVLGVALGIAVAVAIVSIDYNTLLRSQRPSMDVWRADLEVRPKPEVDDPTARLADLPGVTASTEVLQADGEALPLTQALAGATRGRPVRVLGLDATNLDQRVQDSAVKSLLRDNTTECLERGVYGVPTFEADGELFWGQDRLDHVARKLAGTLPEPNDHLRAMLARPIAMQRRSRGWT